MEHKHRLTATCRAKALEAGMWQQSDGTFVELRGMADGHLVNALLKALADGDRRGITEPLAAEVARRGLQDTALAIAGARDERSGACRTM